MSCHDNDEINDWLKKVVDWYAPLGIGSVVYDPSNSGSHKIAQVFLGLLSDSGAKDVSLVSGDSLNKVKKNNSVAVLCEAVTSGRFFSSVNRELRHAGHSGNRIFISPFITAQSKKGFISLKSTIEKSSDDFPYSLIFKSRLFVGPSSLSNIWDKELEVISGFQDAFWMARASLLRRQSKGIDKSISSAVGSGGDDFSVDFAFWKEGYNPKDVSSAAVFATICCLLQHYRELPPEDPSSLAGGIYSPVLIDPENFWRFNDGLLQACLWRAALNSELDYRCSSLASSVFSRLVIKYIKEAGKGKSQIYLDYLMSIAVGKVRVLPEHLGQIVREGKSVLGGAGAGNEILDYLNSRFL